MNQQSVTAQSSVVMSGPRTRLVIFCGLGVLIAACFGPVLFGGRQFAQGDTGHYYYPLHYRIQQQWRAGLLPLWEPAEDGGTPLLGSPQAAVLYPGKLIFAVLPYPWAARLYVIAHVLIAFLAMRAMLKAWGVGSVGASLAGFSYAFGAPVLFQSSNVIFLVGAAWAPLGFRAADAWLRLGTRWGLIQLAIVLTLQALGGDIQAAYLTAVCAAGYAVGLASSRRSFWKWALALAIAPVVWAVAAAALDQKIGLLRSRPAQVVLLLAWAILIAVWMTRMLRDPNRRPLGIRFLGLVAAGILAILLGAVQFVPVAQNIAACARWSSEGNLAVESFSLEPYRLVELVWPNAFGRPLGPDRYWLMALPPIGGHRIWMASLYLGALPLVLAVAGRGFRDGPPWRGWLTAVAIVGLLASFGKFADPLPWVGSASAGGSFYRFLASLLPGFGGFRYPSKLLVFVCLAISGLAGIGWERFAAGKCRHLTVLTTILLALSLIGSALLLTARGPILRAIGGPWLHGIRSNSGPLDVAGAWADTQWALGHGVIAFALTLAVLRLTANGRTWAGLLGLCVLAADLSIANSGLIFSLAQRDFDRPGEAAEIIRDAEKTRGSDDPFRIYRMYPWSPMTQSTLVSGDRAVELASWERDTLLPNYAMLDGLESTLTDSGSLQPEALERTYRNYTERVDAKVAAAIEAEPGQEVLCYPRGAFDLWNTRYFLLPVYPLDWKQPDRALISFLNQTEVIYPRPGARNTRWPQLEDFQIRRNIAAYPRVWIVHDFLAIDPDSGPEIAEYAARAKQILARGSSSRNRAFDPHAAALIETTRPGALDPYRSRGKPGLSEAARIVRSEPHRVEIAVKLERPGLVVLSERFDPGWTLTIDGESTVVLKANNLMRAAAVRSGSHTLVFHYRPCTIRIGGLAFLVGFAALLSGCLWARRQRTQPI